MHKTPVNIKSQTPPSRYLDDPLFSLANSAMSLFNTTLVNFEFAMALNQAYQLHLLRIDDCPVADTNYPCFIYHDRNTLLSFVMLDRPMQLIDDPVFQHYDKMLIVRGRDARQFLQQLYDDTSTRLPEPPADEPLRHNHWLALRQLGGTVIDSATFFFQPTGAPLATSLHPDTAMPMPKQLVAYLGRVKQFLTEAFATFEWTLGNPDELQ